MDSRQTLQDKKAEQVTILSAVEVQQNEQKFGEFQASVAALKAEFTSENIIGIDDFEVKKFNDILEKLASISSPNPAQPKLQNVYVLKMENIIARLNPFHVYHPLQAVILEFTKIVSEKTLRNQTRLKVAKCNQADVLKYEKRLLAKASTEAISKDIIVLGNNRYQQTIEKKVAEERKNRCIR